MQNLKPYIPNELPIKTLGYGQLIQYIGEANKSLGEYKGLLQGIPNPDIMLSPLLRQEAVLSSKIEGTQGTEREVLEHEAGLEKTGEKRKDIQEIINYRKALRQAKEHLHAYPIRLNFICALHKILMNSVRGKNKSPGEFRKEQNWIGNAECKIEEASFIPPAPLQMNGYLQEWEQYLEYNDKDILLQTAIMHAQFELLHPFMDGNGRIGRILIPLFLFHKQALPQPMFYLSEYLENNRDEYYQRLQNISQKNDWDGWIIFFLKAISTQAIHNSARVKKIIELYDNMKNEIQKTTGSQFSLYLLDAIFEEPIFSVSALARKLHTTHGMHKQTAADYLRKLKDADILEEVRAGSGRRSALFSFDILLELAESGVVK